MESKIEENNKKGRAFIHKNGEDLTEMTFSKAGQSQIIIDHTHVDDSLRGKGIGRKLLNCIVIQARSENKKIIPLCPFAKKQFDKGVSISDVLA